MIEFKSLTVYKYAMKRNIARELNQEININAQQPELTTRELLDSSTDRSLRSFVLQFMKPYLIGNVHDDFPLSVYTLYNVI